LGLVECGFGGLKGAEDLQEGEEVFPCASGKAVEGMADQVCVLLLVDQETDRESFGCGTIICVGDMWDTSANREASYDWGRDMVEVRSCRQLSSLLSRYEGPFYKEAFGVSLNKLVNMPMSS